MKSGKIEQPAKAPDGYHLNKYYDFKRDKKITVLVNLLSLVIFALFCYLGNCYVPMLSFFICMADFSTLLFVIAVLSIYVMAVIVHELLHGIPMYLFSKVKPYYGYNIIYAYTGSSAYFNKMQYLITTLCPAVVITLVMGVVSFVIPKEYFWCTYYVLLINIAGAAGDIYMTYIISKQEPTLLVNDTGINMSVYYKD